MTATSWSFSLMSVSSAIAASRAVSVSARELIDVSDWGVPLGNVGEDAVQSPADAIDLLNPKPVILDSMFERFGLCRTHPIDGRVFGRDTAGQVSNGRSGH